MRDAALMALAAALLWTGPAPAQQATGVPGPALDDTVSLGRVATLAPLCGLRDDAWAYDLRRALIRAATGTPSTDDASLRAAPGSGQASAALGFAEMDALEQFAAATPREACAALSGAPDLGRADQLVKEFRWRAQADKPVG